jgi:hypothetical protein
MLSCDPNTIKLCNRNRCLRPTLHRNLIGDNQAGRWTLSMTPWDVVGVSAFSAWWMISRATA